MIPRRTFDRNVIKDRSLVNKDIEGSFRLVNVNTPAKRETNRTDDIDGSRSHSRKGFTRKTETNPLNPHYDSERVDYAKRAQANLLKFIDKATDRFANLITNKSTLK